MTNAAISHTAGARAAAGLIDLPAPPLSLPTGENAYRVGESALVTLNDGQRIKGALLAFPTHHGNLFLRLESRTGIDAREIALEDVRTVHVLRDRKIASLSPMLAVRGKVIMPPVQQEFEVFLDNDERLSGHTFGFRTDRNGLHLYPAHDTNTYTHLFVCSHAVRTQRVGPLLGNALLEENLVTYETLSRELAAQHALRQRPIGEYLMSARLVTAKELEAALARQRSMPQLRLGEVLVSDGVITEGQLADALRRQARDRKIPLGEMLVAAGLVSVENVKQTLARKIGIPFIDLRRFAVDAEAVQLLAESVAREHQVMPLYFQDGRMVVALDDPTQWQAVDAVRTEVRMDVEAVMATAPDIAWAIDVYYGARHVEPR